jgi:hypothetical protein
MSSPFFLPPFCSHHPCLLQHDPLFANGGNVHRFEIYDAKNTTEPQHQLRDRWFLLDAVSGEYWNIGDRFDVESARWIAERLLGLFRYQGSIGRPSGQVRGMPLRSSI